MDDSHVQLTFDLPFLFKVFSLDFFHRISHGEKKQNSEDSWMYPYQRTPKGNPYIMGYDPQESLESLENTINTMSTLTLLGGTSNCPLKIFR